jgi:hypothetical protein
MQLLIVKRILKQIVFKIVEKKFGKMVKNKMTLENISNYKQILNRRLNQEEIENL